MASQRKRFTTEEVVAYFGRNDSSNEEELAGETFTDFIGVVVSDTDSEGVSGDRREGCKSNELVSGNDSSEQEDETDASMLPGAEAESISHVDHLPLQDDVRDNVALNLCNPYNSSNTSESSDGIISDSSFRAQNVTSHHLSTSELSISESESSEEAANDSESAQQPSSARHIL